MTGMRWQSAQGSQEYLVTFILSDRISLRNRRKVHCYFTANKTNLSPNTCLVIARMKFANPKQQVSLDNIFKKSRFYKGEVSLEINQILPLRKRAREVIWLVKGHKATTSQSWN